MSFYSQHHSFDITLAQQYGIEEAILIHHFQHWIRINKINKTNIHEGRTWTFQTLDYIASHFPYMNRDKIYYLIEKLCLGKSPKNKKGDQEFSPVLVKGNFNKNKYDRTVWYAFVEEEKWIPPINLENSKMMIGGFQNGDCHTPTPIPDTIPDTKPYKEDPPISPKGGSPHRKKVIEEKIQRAPEVFLTDTQHQTMLNKCNGDEKLLNLVYNNLSDWKIGKGITGGKNDFKACSGWALEEARKQTKDNPEEKNKSFIDKIKKKYPNHKSMNFGHNYIEFIRGSISVYIKFTDSGFYDQVCSELRKININPNEI